MKHLPLLLCVLLFGLVAPVRAQALSESEILFLTAQWQGERYPDGRPKVAAEILERMKQLS